MYDVNEIISWHYKANELRLHEFMCVKIFFRINNIAFFEE